MHAGTHTLSSVLRKEAITQIHSNMGTNFWLQLYWQLMLLSFDTKYIVLKGWFRKTSNTETLWKSQGGPRSTIPGRTQTSSHGNWQMSIHPASTLQPSATRTQWLSICLWGEQLNQSMALWVPQELWDRRRQVCVCGDGAERALKWQRWSDFCPTQITSLIYGLESGLRDLMPQTFLLRGWN